MSGHVFVMQGDLMALACDAWLVPGDHVGPGSTWTNVVPRRAPVALPPDWGAPAGPRAMLWPALSPGPRVPEPFLTCVAGNNRQGASFHVGAAREFVRLAADHVKARAPFHKRARHLLALPLVGTGFGGAGHIAGDVVRLLLRALREEAAAHEVDIALVLRDGPAFAAVQHERLLDAGVAFAALSEADRAAAEALAQMARDGDLVVFLGAGVSQGAGLPGWNAMLAELAERAGIEEIVAFERLGELDKAAIIERRLGPDKSLGSLVADHLRSISPLYSLGHGLTASLPVDEVITTNYDQLFERASAATGRPVKVLPGGQAARGERWLLKMHGCVSRPESIVLTREDYLRFQENRSALAGIVQALLITRHMLFVGFSFSDDNFHRIAHTVRQALRPREGEARAHFGTTLVVNPNPLARELWSDDISWLTFDQGPAGEDPRSVAEQIRRIEIFLDLVAARAATATSHLGDRRYEAVLSPAERALRDSLLGFARAAGDDVRGTDAWGEVARMLKRLGVSGG